MADIEQCKKEIAELKGQIEQLRGDPEKTPCMFCWFASVLTFISD